MKSDYVEFNNANILQVTAKFSLSYFYHPDKKNPLYMYHVIMSN